MAKRKIARERWKAIPGFTGYEASDLGRIRSVDRYITYPNGQRHFHKGQLIKPCKNFYGRPIVKLGGKEPTRSVSVYIALTFIGKRPGRLEVCHNNDNAWDNRVENLRYDTRSANNKDRVINGTDNRGTRHWNSKLTENDVRKIRISKKPSYILAMEYKISRGQIGSIKMGTSWAWLDNYRPYVHEGWKEAMVTCPCCGHKFKERFHTNGNNPRRTI